MKNVSFILWKKLNELFGKPNGMSPILHGTNVCIKKVVIVYLKFKFIWGLNFFVFQIWQPYSDLAHSAPSVHSLLFARLTPFPESGRSLKQLLGRQFSLFLPLLAVPTRQGGSVSFAANSSAPGIVFSTCWPLNKYLLKE